MKNLVEIRKGRIAEVEPEDQHVMAGNGYKGERCCGRVGEEAAKRAAHDGDHDGGYGQAWSVEGGRVFESDAEAAQQARPCKYAPIPRRVGGGRRFGGLEKTKQRAEHEQRTGEI